MKLYCSGGYNDSLQVLRVERVWEAEQLKQRVVRDDRLYLLQHLNPAKWRERGLTGGDSSWGWNKYKSHGWLVQIVPASLALEEDRDFSDTWFPTLDQPLTDCYDCAYRLGFSRLWYDGAYIDLEVNSTPETYTAAAGFSTGRYYD